MHSKTQEVYEDSMDSHDREFRSLQALVSVIKFKHKYYCFNKERYTASKKKQMWHVAPRSNKKRDKTKGHLIKKGMQLRFGKVAYKVKYISTITEEQRTKAKDLSRSKKIVPLYEPN